MAENPQILKKYQQTDAIYQYFDKL